MKRDSNDSGQNRLFSTQTIFSATGFLLVGTALSKVLGFVRDVITAKVFGASASMDAFLVAQSAPNIIGSTLGSVLATAFVPVYIRAVVDGEFQRGRRLVRAIVALSLVVSLLTTVILLAGAEHVISALAPELPQEVFTMAVEKVKFLSLLVAGLLYYNLLSAIYHARNHFIIPTFSQLAENIVVITFLVLLGSVWGIDALVVGTTLGVLGIGVAMLIPLLRTGEVSLTGGIRGSGIADMLIAMWPLLIGVLAYQLPPIVERYFASGLDEGTISSLGYARRLVELPSVLLITTVTTAAFPTLARLYAEKKVEELGNLERRITCQLMYVVVPIAALLVFFGDTIVHVVYQRGAFGGHAAAMTNQALIYYAIGLVANAGYTVLNKTFYSIGDTRTPMFCGLIAVAVNILGNAVLVDRMGIGGIALASTLMYGVVWLLLRVIFERRTGVRNSAVVFWRLVRAVICAAMAITVVAFAVGVDPGVPGVILGSALFAAVYFMAGVLVLPEETHFLVAAAGRMMRGARRIIGLGY